jgi:hypothetical protein
MWVYVKRGSCVFVAVTLTLLGPPVARADEASLVTSAKGLGFTISDENIISIGRSACYFLSRNRDPGQVAERVGRYGNVDSDSAWRFLDLSVREYCPQYGDRVATGG